MALIIIQPTNNYIHIWMLIKAQIKFSYNSYHQLATYIAAYNIYIYIYMYIYIKNNLKKYEFEKGSRD